MFAQTRRQPQSQRRFSFMGKRVESLGQRNFSLTKNL